MTNNELLNYHNDIQRMYGTGLHYLLRGRISEFYKEYGVRIESLLNTINKLQKEFFEFDENSQIKTQPEFEEKEIEVVKDKKFIFGFYRKIRAKEISKTPTGRVKAICKEGKTQEEFTKQLHEILEKEVGAGLAMVK